MWYPLFQAQWDRCDQQQERNTVSKSWALSILYLIFMIQKLSYIYY